MEWTLLWVSALSNCKQYELEKHSLTLSYCPLTDLGQSLFCASLVKKKKLTLFYDGNQGTLEHAYCTISQLICGLT